MQIQHLSAEISILRTTVQLLESHIEHLEAIERVWIRMRAVSSRVRGAKLLHFGSDSNGAGSV